MKCVGNYVTKWIWVTWGAPVASTAVGYLWGNIFDTKRKQGSNDSQIRGLRMYLWTLLDESEVEGGEVLINYLQAVIWSR